MAKIILFDDGIQKYEIDTYQHFVKNPDRAKSKDKYDYFNEIIFYIFLAGSAMIIGSIAYFLKFNSPFYITLVIFGILLFKITPNIIKILFNFAKPIDRSSADETLTFFFDSVQKEYLALPIIV